MNEDMLIEGQWAWKETNPDAQPEEIVSLPQALESVRRIRYHKKCMADLQGEQRDLSAPLFAEARRIQIWADTQVKDLEKRIQFHESRLRVYYLTHPPAKGKTVHIPGAVLKERPTAKGWVIKDSAAALAVCPWLYEDKKVLSRELIEQKCGINEDGTVYDLETGLIVPGVDFKKPETKFYVKLDGEPDGDSDGGK